MYGLGQGVERDYTEARKWYRLAADKGQSNALYSLGLIYKEGLGVKQNYSKALKWFLLAAEQGFPEAKNVVQELEKYLADPS